MIYISSILWGNVNYRIIEQVVKGRTGVGVEYFAFELSQAEVDSILEMSDALQCPCTLHSPMLNCESTSVRGTKEHDMLMENWDKSIQLAVRLGAKQIVFHTNNCYIDKRDKEFLSNLCKDNTLILAQKCRQYGIDMLVETLSLPVKGEPLFTDKEFVRFVFGNKLSALVDVGHMNLNGFDYEYVVSSLNSNIKAYHLHNNDGKNDIHDEISCGTFDYQLFAKNYSKYTPNADLVFEYIETPQTTAQSLYSDIDFLIQSIDRYKK